jgi:methionyl-tRNA formyltransferase
MSLCRLGVDDMPTNLDRTPESWRLAVFTNMPGGFFFSLVHEAAQTMGHRVVGVLTTPGPRRRRSASYLEVVAAVPPGIDVLVSNHPGRWAATVATWQPDLIVSGGFPWRIPAEVLDAARYGGINTHDALLPRHRGPNATGWAFRLGDRETGVTIHRLSPEFDTGAILAQHRVPIEDHDTWDTLLPQFVQALPALLGQAIDRIARGDPGDPQDEALATEAGLFPPEWRPIDWNQPARSIHNQVRSWVGLRDIPAGALGELDGQMTQIVRTRLLPPRENGTRTETPGTILKRSDDHLVVQCGDGPLEILEWHPLVGDS